MQLKSSNNIFFNPDFQVNSVLGQLRVIGDVGRDVLLTLSDPGSSPVSIQVTSIQFFQSSIFNTFQRIQSRRVVALPALS